MTARHPFAGEQREISASAERRWPRKRWPCVRLWWATPFACALLLTILLGWTLRVADLGRFSLSMRPFSFLPCEGPAGMPPLCDPLGRHEAKAEARTKTRAEARVASLLCALLKTMLY